MNSILTLPTKEKKDSFSSSPYAVSLYNNILLLNFN